VVSVPVLQIEAFKPTLAALGPNDCPLVPSLENFAAGGPPETHSFAREQFHIDENGQGRTVTKEGQSRRQIYALKSGVAIKTDLALMRNDAAGLPAAGFTIANVKRDPSDDLVAGIARDGSERRVRVRASNGNTISVLEVAVAPFVPSLAPPGPNDCPRPTTRPCRRHAPGRWWPGSPSIRWCARA